MPCRSSGQVCGNILLGYLLSLGIALLRVPGSLQCRCGVVEVLGHGADVVVLQRGNLVNLARLALTEEHVLQTVIAEDASIGGLDEVVEVRHRLFITQNVGQVISGHGPCVGVGVDGIDIGGAEKESLGVLPVGAGGLPVGTGLVERSLRAIHYGVVGIVVA